jgi:hypothetical protein
MSNPFLFNRAVCNAAAAGRALITNSSDSNHSFCNIKLFFALLPILLIA